MYHLLRSRSWSRNRSAERRPSRRLDVAASQTRCAHTCNTGNGMLYFRCGRCTQGLAGMSLTAKNTRARVDITETSAGQDGLPVSTTSIALCLLETFRSVVQTLWSVDH